MDNNKIAKIMKISSCCCIFVLVLALYLYSQTNNQNIDIERNINLADVSCVVTSGPNVVYGYDGDYSVTGNCSRDFKKTGNCYQKGGTADTSKCGSDDGLDCYVYFKYHVECSGCAVSNCQTCVSGSTTKCSVCNSGYVSLDGINCTKVSAPCCINGTTTQTSTTLCQNAAKNGTLTHMGACTSTCTVDHCSKCVSNNNAKCSVCDSGYEVTAAGKCQIKAVTCNVAYCQKCVSGNSNKCSECVNNYHVSSDGSCTKNAATCSVANCSTCKTGDVNTCVSCKSGYIVSSTGKCTEVTAPCCVSGTTVKDTNSCKQAANSGASFSLGECSPKSSCNVENCTTCSSTDSTKCSVCKSGYHVYGGACVADPTSCPAGQGLDSFHVCSPCGAGYWSEEGSISCATKCPAGYACKNGSKTKCDTDTPEGSSVCFKCEVNNCKTCVADKKDVCSVCKSGYSLNSKGKCYWPGNSSSPPASKDACYKNTTNNEYIYGQYDNQTGYSKLTNDQSTCNKVLIKLVDDAGLDLIGAVVTITSNANPSNPTNYNIGKKDIELLAPGTYTLKESIAPTNYQLDADVIEITVDSLGIINVKTTSPNVSLGTTNNTRNVTLTWKNLISSPVTADEDEEKCYIKYSDNSENEYCYGKKDACSDYTDSLTGRDIKSCKEDVACYTNNQGTYVSGKYANRNGYTYYASSCPKCYKNQNGVLTWGSFEDVKGFTLEPNITKDQCKTATSTSTKGSSKLIYIILIILIIAAIIVVALKGKTKDNSNKDNDDNNEDDSFNYNYHV